MEKYNTLLIEKNKVLNLTAHKCIDSSWKYNVLDSLLFNDIIPNVGKFLDIGSGGGSPAIPLKLSFPQINMTMLDSVGKKVNFLNEVVGELNLENTIAIHSRIEEFVIANRDSFDVVTARAVASLPTLLEYALPALKIGGILLAFKGKNVSEEIESATNALKILGGEVGSIEQRQLDDETTRYLVIIKKVKQTPKQYPRGKNLPRLKPL